MLELAALSYKFPCLVLHRAKVGSLSASLLPSEGGIQSEWRHCPSLPSVCAFHILRRLRCILCMWFGLFMCTCLLQPPSGSQSLFVIMDGPHKGFASSSATILWWIRHTFTKFYKVYVNNYSCLNSFFFPHYCTIWRSDNRIFRNVCKFSRKKKTEILHLVKYSDLLLSTLLKRFWQHLHLSLFA